MGASPPWLRCERLRKSFPGVLALNDMSLQVEAGAIHALVGENGAGKSTLVKILSGALRPDGGRMEINGQLMEIAGVRDARRQGIAVVHQELNLVRDLSVGENIFLGRWPTSRWTQLIDYPSLHQHASALLASLGISLPVRTPVGELTAARQQMVEIARALSLEAQLLILDEPSAVLTPHELQPLFKLVRELKRRGVAVIYISHRLDEIFDLADVVTVMRDGRPISTRPIQEARRDRLIAEMVGRELTDEFPPRNVPIGDVVLKVEHLSAGRRVHEVSFDVRAGEVLGVTGLVGSGRSSLLKIIFGAICATSGKVQVGDVRGPFAHPREAMAAGVACLPEDRQQEGLLLERNVRENVTLANLSSYAVGGLLNAGRERAAAKRLMHDLRIRAVSTESSIHTLSGGNQQKVLLARWMDRPHHVVLLDEPTRGVDVGAKYEIYTLINRLAAERVAMVMVSSELPEVIGMADRIAVMGEGRMMGILDNRKRQVTQEEIMRLASGACEKGFSHEDN